jgi:transglutaminase-like putative cysteine protease
MIYDVRQTTTYAYASAAAYAHHVLRLMPIARERQRVTAAVLDIDPVPVRRREGRDFFENRTTMIEIDAPHNTLTVKLAARIAVEPVAPADFDATPPWESVRA